VEPERRERPLTRNERAALEAGPTHSGLAKIGFALSAIGSIPVMIVVVASPLRDVSPQHASTEVAAMQQIADLAARTGALWGLCLILGAICGFLSLLQEGRRKLLGVLVMVPLGLSVVGIGISAVFGSS
jgi:hypothetical protein